MPQIQTGSPQVSGGFALIPGPTDADNPMDLTPANNLLRNAAFTGVVSAGTIQINAGGALIMGGVSYTPPVGYPGANGYVLSSTTSGVLSWIPNGGGGGGGQTLSFGPHLVSGSLSSYNGTVAGTIITDQTAANTPSTIMGRDASGNFAAGLAALGTLTTTGGVGLNGNSVPTNAALTVGGATGGTMTTGTNQWGVFLGANFDGTATTRATALDVIAQFPVAATNTLQLNVVRIRAPSLTGGGVLIGTSYGLLIDNQAATGISIAYAIQTGTGLVQFGDAVTMTSSASVGTTLTVTGGVTFTSGSLSINGVGYAFPNAGGAANTVLINNGANALSWGTLALTLADLTWSGHITSAASSYNGSAAVAIATDGTFLNTLSTLIARDGTTGGFDAGDVTTLSLVTGVLEVVGTNATMIVQATYAGNASAFQSTMTGSFSSEVYVQPTFTTGTVTSMSGVFIDAPAYSGGAVVTQLAALRIGNQSGATTNYAILTGTGLVTFGDAVSTSSTLSAAGLTSTTTLAVTGLSTLTGGLSSAAATLTSTLTSTIGTITTNTPALTATQTWNAAGVSFFALDVQVTNTASAAGARVARFRRATTTLLDCDVNGNVTTAGSISTGATITSGGNLASGGYIAAGNTTRYTDTANGAALITNAGATALTRLAFGVATTAGVAWSLDTATSLSLTLGNGTGNAQLTTGYHVIATAGNGLSIKSAAVSAGTANAKVVTGVALTAGTATVNNTAVVASSVPIVIVTTPAGTLSTVYSVTKSAGVSFTVTGQLTVAGAPATNTLDTSTLAVIFIEAG
jgi:hypothetical protein